MDRLGWCRIRMNRNRRFGIAFSPRGRRGQLPERVSSTGSAPVRPALGSTILIMSRPLEMGCIDHFVHTAADLGTSTNLRRISPSQARSANG